MSLTREQVQERLDDVRCRLAAACEPSWNECDAGARALHVLMRLECGRCKGGTEKFCSKVGGDHYEPEECDDMPCLACGGSGMHPIAVAVAENNPIPTEPA